MTSTNLVVQRNCTDCSEPVDVLQSFPAGRVKCAACVPAPVPAAPDINIQPDLTRCLERLKARTPLAFQGDLALPAQWEKWLVKWISEPSGRVIMLQGRSAEHAAWAGLRANVAHVPGLASVLHVDAKQVCDDVNADWGPERTERLERWLNQPTRFRVTLITHRLPIAIKRHQHAKTTEIWQQILLNAEMHGHFVLVTFATSEPEPHDWWRSVSGGRPAPDLIRF